MLFPRSTSTVFPQGADISRCLPLPPQSQSQSQAHTGSEESGQVHHLPDLTRRKLPSQRQTDRFCKPGHRAAACACPAEAVGACGKAGIQQDTSHLCSELAFSCHPLAHAFNVAYVSRHKYWSRWYDLFSLLPLAFKVPLHRCIMLSLAIYFSILLYCLFPSFFSYYLLLSPCSDWMPLA